ncbi:MAG: cyclic nucleotide-binding domain-containing protein [Chloroflexota bacterium]
MSVEKTLKRAEVFLGLDDSELSKIADLPSCQEETYQAGDLIIREGDEARSIYVLKEGRLDLMMEVPSEEKQVVVERITTGSFFGWSALVKPHSYVMSAVCSAPSTVVKISGAELLALFEQDYRIGYKVFQSLSHTIGVRLRVVEQVLLTGQKRWPFLEKRKTPRA